MQELYPIKTHCEELDIIIGGFYPGELTLICGSSYQFFVEGPYFLFAIAKMITCGTGMPGFLFASYYQPRTIYCNFIASITGIPETKIYDGKFDKAEATLVKTITKQVYDLPLVIRPMPYFEKLIKVIYKTHKKKGIKIIYLECLPRLKTDTKFSGSEENAFEIIKLKQLAKKLNISIIVSSYMLWIDEGIVNNSDNILFFDKFQKTGDIGQYNWKMKVLKTHDGKLGTYNLMFKPGTLTFL
jgi:replicative DNA helicase